MITKLILENFKSIKKEEYDFTQFDLLVGRNNSGKSTVLQALAIWQFCVDQFKFSKRSGSKGIQIVLPNFTALPVPEFNLLWKDRTDRHFLTKDGVKKQEYILIRIRVEWQKATGEKESFGVELRYHSSQTIYAIPEESWEKFHELEKQDDFPRIAYVPPFSGLEPNEKALDVSPIRQQVGKGQPGSVLRNLLLSVCPSTVPTEKVKGTNSPKKIPENWQELAEIISRWFSVKIHEPKYNSMRDVYITVEYEQNGKDYDIIAGGSGFHQTLSLLAFLYGYHPTTILLDEPDAHLHVNLQREILDFFKRKSIERNIQFLIATHSEEFVKGVDVSEILSLLNKETTRIESTPNILNAMAVVSNEEIARMATSPFILYVEGESDERILRAWAAKCDAQVVMDKFCFKSMDGGSKKDMKTRMDEHFAALKVINPKVIRLMLFDYDDARDYHPPNTNHAMAEWKRKNIENYLLVPDAWKRTVSKKLMLGEGDLFVLPVIQIIEDFFNNENLSLPPKKTWRNVDANVFSVVDGKRILFKNIDSLFQLLRKCSTSVTILREEVAITMNPDEIHDDVHKFFEKLSNLVK